MYAGQYKGYVPIGFVRIIGPRWGCQYVYYQSSTRGHVLSGLLIEAMLTAKSQNGVLAKNGVEKVWFCPAVSREVVGPEWQPYGYHLDNWPPVSGSGGWPISYCHRFGPPEFNGDNGRFRWAWQPVSGVNNGTSAYGPPTAQTTVKEPCPRCINWGPRPSCLT